MYYKSFSMIREPKSDEFQVNKKFLHIISIFKIPLRQN